MYKVVEKFISINGEGKKAGQLAVFIRLKGCNLDCEYCDTKWANEKEAAYEEMSAEEIYDYIKSSNVRNVTLTGGEPLIQKDFYQFLKLLSEDNSIEVEIETNGSVSLKEFINIQNAPAFTMDYKLSASGMEERMCHENFELLEKKDTVKFVVGSRNDLIRANEIIEKYKLKNKCSIYFSPVFGMIKPEEIVDFMIEKKLNYVNIQLQLHKFIWDPNLRGV